MGAAFSSEEKKELGPYLKGFDPMALAGLIRDTINGEGLEGQDEKGGPAGIVFGGDGSEEQKDNVTFWEDGQVTTLPKNIFLELMKMAAEDVLKTYDEIYDLKRSPALQNSVETLKEALGHLDEHLDAMENKVSPAEYKKFLDEEYSDSEESESDNYDEDDDDEDNEDVEEEEEEEEEEEKEEEKIKEESKKTAPVHNLKASLRRLSLTIPLTSSTSGTSVPPPLRLSLSSPTLDTPKKEGDSSADLDDNFAPPLQYIQQRRKSTRGIVGVMDRLPELRGRFDNGELEETQPEQTTPPKPQAFDKVKKKVKLLSLFHIGKEGTAEESEMTKSPPALSPAAAAAASSQDLKAPPDRAKSLENVYNKKKKMLQPSLRRGSLPENMTLSLLQRARRSSVLFLPSQSIEEEEEGDDDVFEGSPQTSPGPIPTRKLHTSLSSGSLSPPTTPPASITSLKHKTVSSSWKRSTTAAESTPLLPGSVD